MNHWFSINTILNNKRLALFLLSTAWLIVNFLLCARLGVKIVNDSARYLEYADLLKDGFFFDPHNFWYISYVLFIYCVKLFSPDNGAVIVAQCIVSLISVFALYQASFNVFKNQKSSFITTLLYIGFVEIAAWNFYIIPESFFVSIVCIALYFITIPNPGNTARALKIVLIIIAFFCKPTGISILVAYIIYAISVDHDSSKKYRLIIPVCIVVVISYFLLNRMLHTFILIENYQKGEIVYGITTLPDHPDYVQLIVHPPDNLYIPDVHRSPLARLFLFVTHNPVFFAKIFLAKVFYNLVNIRPYWSLWHNIFSVSFLCLFYYFFIRGLTFLPGQPLKLFVSTYILLNVIILGFTTVDWDGRFLIPLLPFVLLVGGYGFNAFLWNKR